MQRMVLINPVIITGRDVFGRQSTITFSPADKAGWFWRYHPKKPPLPITANLLVPARRRTRLAYFTPDTRKSYFFEYCEHFLPLHWLGLDRVIIETNKWPPYFGRVREVWDALRPYCAIAPALPFGWVMPERDVSFIHPAAPHRWIKIFPHSLSVLRITVICAYPGIGKMELYWDTDEPIEHLETYFGAHTQGWPPWVYYASRYIPKPLWRHHHAVTWPQEKQTSEVLRLFAFHRLCDLLAALAAVHPTSILAAHVVSHCSGHRIDVDAVRAIAPDLMHLSLKKRLH